MASVMATAALLSLVLLLTACERRDGDEPATAPVETPSAPATPPGKPTTYEPVAPEDGFVVASHFPQVSDINIALTSAVTVTFNQQLLDNSYEADLLTVTANGDPVAGTLKRLDAATLQFRPASLLQPSTLYQVQVDSEAMSASGLSLTPLSWKFETVADVSTTAQDIIDQCMSATDIAMLASVNAARSTARQCGEDAMAAVAKLTWSCDLQLAAINHAMDMSSNNFFSHSGSDGSTIGDRVSRTGYVWSWVGENIAAGQRSVEQVMQGWLDSPGHCRNIMSPNFSQFGAGLSVNNNSEYQRYWAQAFARAR